MENKTYVKSCSLLQRSWKVILNSCWFVIWAYLSIASVYSAGAYVNRDEPEIRLEIPHAVLSADTDNPFHHITGLRGASAVKEGEAQEEFNLDPDCFDPGAGSQADYFPGLLHHSFLDKTLYFLQAASFRNRATVPFFILYHSWKSFLR